MAKGAEQRGSLEVPLILPFDVTTGAGKHNYTLSQRIIIGLFLCDAVYPQWVVSTGTGTIIILEYQVGT